MKRTTLFVPESLERELQLFARREGRPVASVVREALAEYVVRRRQGHGVPSFAGAFDSARSDIAARHERFLFDGLSAHGDAPTGPVPPARPAKSARRRRRRPTGRKDQG